MVVGGLSGWCARMAAKSPLQRYSYAVASHGGSLPRRRCERAWMVDRSSLGGLSQPMGLPEASDPPRAVLAV